MYRIGNGYDVHRLVDGRKLILGGVEIPHPRGLQGHSDADALVHALCDAILGACGGGDLGAHFPDSDPQWKDVSSLVLLQKVGDVCARRGFRIVNLDTILVAQEPKVAPYLKEMQTRLARTLGLQPGQINLKATTTEHLGFTGREEGIAAYAVALLQQKE